MAQAFYASKISENMGRTPQDYLICRNVPISRTGVQEYYGEECGLDQFAGQKIPVLRADADVFDPASLASFEGMPVTDEHPDEEVTAENVRGYIMGTVRNVRRGDGEDSDKVLADLVIYDKDLVAEIQGGKREVSCGYSCTYETAGDGTVYQRMIRGNHVAVVPAGRAGGEVAIRDSAPPKTVTQTERRNKGMKNSLWKNLIRVTKDADPEAAEALVDAIEDIASNAPATPADEAPAPAAEPPKDAEPPAEEMPPWAKAMMEQMAQIQAQLGAHDEDPVQKLEDELAGGEEKVAVPPEQIDEELAPAADEDLPPATDEEPTCDEDIDPAQDEEPTAAATDSLLKFVRTMKPVIAGIKDAKTKKRVTDALVRTVRGLRGLPSKRGGGYSGILDARASKGRQRAADRSAGAPLDLEKQQAVYDSLNPHKKERR